MAPKISIDPGKEKKKKINSKGSTNTG